MTERVRFAVARVLDDIAWPFFLPLEVLCWLGVRNPRWLVRVVFAVTSPLHVTALRLRGWDSGVSGS